ncbi:cation efflux family-domain-containing protein [Xylariaceae sp. FL1019]|nr:cation efflux family-domain-containing protein [Xylariaceae sp. FL1019]
MLSVPQDTRVPLDAPWPDSIELERLCLDSSIPCVAQLYDDLPLHGAATLLRVLAVSINIAVDGRFSPITLMLAQCRPSFGRRPNLCFAAGFHPSAKLVKHLQPPRRTTAATPHQHHHIRSAGLRTHRLLHSHLQQRRVFQTSCLSPTSSPLTLPLPSSLVDTRSLLVRSVPAMASVTQTRSHSGHHHHHHDNAYLTSSNKKDAGVRITRIGLYSNLGMAIAKFGGGYLFNSQAMIADAFHSVTDLASDFLTLFTISWSIKPPTDKYPQGFGKIESLGSLGVSSMLLFGGGWMFYSSLLTLYGHFFLDPAAAVELAAHAHSHSHAHNHADVIPSLHAAWLAAGTVAVKEWLYQATMKVARERKSSVLASNAIHHRIDSLTGIVTLAVILGANIMQNAAWLDPVGGLLISLMVVKAGAENTLSSLLELVDKAIDDEVKSSIRTQVQKASADMTESQTIELRDVSGIKSGQNYLVDLEVAVPGGWTVEDVREVEEKIRTRVGSKVRGVRKVRIRFVPKEVTASPKFDEFIPGDVSPKSSPEPEAEEGHHHNGDAAHRKSE